LLKLNRSPSDRAHLHVPVVAVLTSLAGRGESLPRRLVWHFGGTASTRPATLEYRRARLARRFEISSLANLGGLIEIDTGIQA
jgi:hypothetical protein